MRKIWLIFSLLFCALPDAWGTIARVQSASSAVTASTTLTVAYSSSNTAGNTLILSVGVATVSGANQAAPAITDSRGNAWLMAGVGATSFPSSADNSSYVFYAANCASGSNTITITAPNSSRIVAIATEYSGLLAAYPYEGSAFNATQTTSTSDSLTTTGTTDLVYAFGFQYYQNSGTWNSTPSGFSNVTSVNAPSYGQMIAWDDTAASASTYSITVTNSNGSLVSLHAGLVAFRSVAPTSGWVQECQGYTASSTTVSCTLPFLPTAGDTVMVTIQNSTSDSLTGVSGCGVTWNLITYTGSGRLITYYAAGMAASSCTVTATYSGSDAYNIIVDEYTGVLNPYSLDTSTTGGTSNSPITASLAAPAANEIIYVAAGADSGTSISSFASTGYTLRGVNANNGGSGVHTVGVLDTLSSAGTNSISVSWNGTYSNANNSVNVVALRVATPNPGSVQYAQKGCSSVTSCALAFNYNVSAGDAYIADIFASSSCTSWFPPTSNTGDTFKLVPLYYATPAGVAGTRLIYYVSNAVGGATTVTVTSGASCNIDLFLTQVHGLNTANPLFNSTMGGPGGNPIVTSSMPNVTGTYLYSSASGMGALATPSSGFIYHQPWVNGFPAYANLYNVFDQVPASSPISNTLTGSGTLNTSWGTLLEFAATNNVYARIVQVIDTGTGLGGSSGSATTLQNVVAGDIGLFFAQNNGTSGSTILPTDSLGSTWVADEGCTSGTTYCLAHTVFASSGADTISYNPLIGMSFHFEEITGVSGTPIHNSGSGTSVTSQSTGNITTTTDKEVVMAFCGNASNENGITATATNFVNRDYASGHTTSGMALDQPQAPVGTYSATCSFGNSINIAGAIIAFPSSAVVSSVQPSITVVKNEVRQFWQLRR
jgi:hypothetical protein